MKALKSKLHTLLVGFAVGVAALSAVMLIMFLNGNLQELMAAGQGTGSADVNARYWNGADWDDSIDLSGTTTLQNVDWASSDNPNTDTQDLSINNNSSDKDDTISLDNGGSVTVADYYESNTDTQDLSINNNSTDKDDTISLDNGGSVTVDDYYETNTEGVSSCSDCDSRFLKQNTTVSDDCQWVTLSDGTNYCGNNEFVLGLDFVDVSGSADDRVVKMYCCDIDNY